MTDYTDGLPARMRTLPRDSAGRPIPKFVETIDGVPDFRVMATDHLRRAVKTKACWVCGEMLGRLAVFTAGPMCLVNLNSAEPPSHYECARYSARLCPFLSNPDKVRREAHLPETRVIAGFSIPRNPGVAALIVVRSWKPYLDHTGRGVLFEMGTPERVEWYCRGRDATRAEVQESLDGGLPTLRAACHGDPVCLGFLDAALERATVFLPA